MPSPAAKVNVPLPPAAAIEKLVGDALREDLGDGDLTAAMIDPAARASAHLHCREAAVLCGAAWFEQAFHQLDPQVEIVWLRADGDHLGAGDSVCAIAGRARALLSAERTAINLLQTLSGTATATRHYVDAVADAANARILDTRKTLPGLRLAQKYATAVGGACNHRFGLYDQILIKENHIAAAGSVAAAIARARASAPEDALQIEVETLRQLRQALDAGATRILLDNFDLRRMRAGVALARGRAKLEASGNVSLRRVRRIAETGVDYISIGALTKHLKAIDFSLRFD
ncbi:MAG: carboxylating nicotinate-nucleotide diphosphorylase [bacterium]